MSNGIKAVIFDMGGVVIGSPLAGIRRYESVNSLPHDYINVAITASGREGAFQKFERNELQLFDFYHLFGEELSRTDQLNEWYTAWCKGRGIQVPKLPHNFKVDGRELFGQMMSETSKVDQAMISAIRKMKANSSLKIAALTNNFKTPDASTPIPASAKTTLKDELQFLAMGSGYENLKAEFDLFMESSVVGMRKPDPKIYQYALDQLGVKGEEAVFLDDIGINLKSAGKLGIKTIRVSLDSSLSAIQELEKAVGMKLLDPEHVKKEEARLGKAKSKL